MYDDRGITNDDLAFTAGQLEKWSGAQVNHSISTKCQILELIALTQFADHNLNEAVETLEAAENLLPQDKNFISKSARLWAMNRDTTSQKTSDILQIPNIPKGIHTKRNVLIAVIISFISIVTLSTPVANFMTYSSASTESKNLAAAAGLNRNGTLFYLRTHPVIDTADKISAACSTPGGSGAMVEFGCFLPAEGKIYVRDMPDELHDSELVTVAHETLHAAYLGLSSDEKDRINALLETAYPGVADDSLASRMAEYENTEPGARSEELHSILGTEYASIGDELEKYYSQYFTDRSLIVMANARVEGKFKSYKTSLDSLNLDIKKLKENSDVLYNAHLRAARNGYAYGANENYRRYSDVFSRMKAKIVEYSGLLESYNLLVQQYNGKSFEAIDTPVQN